MFTKIRSMSKARKMILGFAIAGTVFLGAGCGDGPTGIYQEKPAVAEFHALPNDAQKNENQNKAHDICGICFPDGTRLGEEPAK